MNGINQIYVNINKRIKRKSQMAFVLKPRIKVCLLNFTKSEIQIIKMLHLG